MYIQCFSARSVIGLPATTATSLAPSALVPFDAFAEEDDEEEEPHAAISSAAATKKAQSAVVYVDFLIKTWAIVAASNPGTSPIRQCLIGFLSPGSVRRRPIRPRPVRRPPRGSPRAARRRRGRSPGTAGRGPWAPGPRAGTCPIRTAPRGSERGSP